MCLHNVSLNLRWDKKLRAYVGIGYKKIRRSDLNRYNRLGRWTQASGDRNDKQGKLHEKFEYSNNSQVYHPGFHIFLTKQDAIDYRHSTSVDIYEVIYKNVLSYGQNECGYYTHKPCVVTEYMKLVKVVK